MEALRTLLVLRSSSSRSGRSCCGAGRVVARTGLWDAVDIVAASSGDAANRERVPLVMAATHGGKAAPG